MVDHEKADQVLDEIIKREETEEQEKLDVSNEKGKKLARLS